MKNKECNYVQDLLPNYIENLTTSDTNCLLEEHLRSCKGCSKALNSMKRELPKGNAPANEKEINYLRKFKHKLRFIKFIVLGIFLIFMIIAIRKTIILTTLESKAIQTSLSTNYYIEERISSEAYPYSVRKTYFLDGSFFVKDISYLFEENTDEVAISGIAYTYFSNGDGLYLVNDISNNYKVNFKVDNISTIHPRLCYIYETHFLTNFITSFSTSIHSAVLDGKQCYVLTKRGIEQYIDKETGLILRENNVHRTSDYIYRFDVVTPSDIIRPDPTGYTIISD